MYQLIAVDLDGTLLNQKQEISEGNMKAIKYAQSKGVRVVLCTGRPTHTMMAYVKAIDFPSQEDYFISFNGAYTQNIQNGQVLHAETLSKADVLAWSDEMQRLDIPMQIIDGEKVYESAYPSKLPAYFHRTSTIHMEKETLNFEDLDPQKSYYKFLMASQPVALEAQMEDLNPTLKASYEITQSYPHLYEVAPKNVNKGRAVERLARHLKIPLQAVMAIGDQGNDQTMIQTAGLGVALANATPDLKSQADVITQANHQEDGVAEAIYKYIK